MFIVQRRNYAIDVDTVWTSVLLLTCLKARCKAKNHHSNVFQSNLDELTRCGASPERYVSQCLSIIITAIPHPLPAPPIYPTQNNDDPSCRLLIQLVVSYSKDLYNISFGDCISELLGTAIIIGSMVVVIFGLIGISPFSFLSVTACLAPVRGLPILLHLRFSLFVGIIPFPHSTSFTTPITLGAFFLGQSFL